MILPLAALCPEMIFVVSSFYKGRISGKPAIPAAISSLKQKEIDRPLMHPAEWSLHIDMGKLPYCRPKPIS